MPPIDCPPGGCLPDDGMSPRTASNAAPAGAWAGRLHAATGFDAAWLEQLTQGLSFMLGFDVDAAADAAEARALAARRHLRPAGLLVHGLPGTGKSFLAGHLAATAPGPLDVRIVRPGDLFQKYQSDSEALLRGLFEAGDLARLVVLEELDTVLPRGDPAAATAAASPLAEEDSAGLAGPSPEDQLGRLLRGLLADARGPGCRVAVLGLTSRLGSVAPDVLAPGLLDRQLDLGICQVRAPARRALLEGILRDTPVGRCSADRGRLLDRLADETHGYVAADLAGLARAAVCAAAGRAIASADGHAPGAGPADVCLTWADLEEALRGGAGPASLAAASTASLCVPVRRARTLGFDQLAGLEREATQLRMAAVWPFAAGAAAEHGAAGRFRRLSERLGARPEGGILLHGPSGCGKTALALALAHETALTVLLVDAARLRDKVSGASEGRLAGLFATARAAAPCVLVFDQIELIAGRRRAEDADASGTAHRLTTALLTEMDGVLAAGSAASSRPQIVVVGITGDARQLDEAVIRPGRLGHHILVPAPDRAARAAVIRLCMARTPVESGDDLLVDSLAAATRGWSPADLNNLFNEAALAALRESIDTAAVPVATLWQCVREGGPSLPRDAWPPT
ncbi:hypothetical protein H696_02743 [Fonticula alba]|uniref:AAA+ ATPase domain-containing protein n=1 Tax=Fonticula alba TaxID=691883 RepID=A0A058ZA49_FONAL|nr:hypothetical protein H696_02743 [Fonticula alba]KCV70407.1 hypothetical protein H696_02743 [Fonticula alba]|eukprot:XP_009494923.1 hypothetical protein H696_02743 [Fonticula alba]